VVGKLVVLPILKVLEHILDFSDCCISEKKKDFRSTKTKNKNKKGPWFLSG